MTKERDYQKSRLYKAEDVLEAHSHRLETVEEMVSFLTKVMNRAPIQRRYAPYLRSNLVVKDGRRRRVACGGSGSINMPKWSRTAYIVLHEVAHTLTIRKYGANTSAHGREYAAVYLDLVRFGLGKEAHAALLASFKANRVKYRAPARRAKPVFTDRVKFRVAAKTMPRKPKAVPTAWDKECAKAYREFKKLAKEFEFTFKIDRERGTRLAWLETDTFPCTGQRFTTMHYDWAETLRRVKACIEDPLLLDEGGGYSE